MKTDHSSHIHTHTHWVHALVAYRALWNEMTYTMGLFGEFFDESGFLASPPCHAIVAGLGKHGTAWQNMLFQLFIFFHAGTCNLHPDCISQERVKALGIPWHPLQWLLQALRNRVSHTHTKSFATRKQKRPTNMFEFVFSAEDGCNKASRVQVYVLICRLRDWWGPRRQSDVEHEKYNVDVTHLQIVAVVLKNTRRQSEQPHLTDRKP